MPEKSVPLVSSKLDGPPQSQGWAFIMLAKMKVPHLLPRLKDAFRSLDEAPRGFDRATPSELRADLYYSLLLLGTDEAKTLLEERKAVDIAASCLARIAMGSQTAGKRQASSILQGP